jgi:hypothetical protein
MVHVVMLSLLKLVKGIREQTQARHPGIVMTIKRAGSVDSLFPRLGQRRLDPGMNDRVRGQNLYAAGESCRPFRNKVEMALNLWRNV